MVNLKIEKIGTCKPAKGTVRHGFIPVKGSRKIAVSVIKGKYDGKTIFVSGGIHGDEINGVKLVHMIMESIDPKKLHGTIIFLPLINLSGFQKSSCKASEDQKNINRCFAKRGKSISYFVAKTIFKEVVAKCDFGIDCHDCGKKNVLLPHSRVHESPDPTKTEGSTIEFGRLFGTKIIMMREGSRGMLAREAAHKLNKPVLTIEVGGGLIFWNDFLKDAVVGVHNILINHNMLKGKIRLPREQYILKDLDRFTYKARREGLLYKKVNIGDKVHKGDIIAEIYNPITRKRKKIISKHCGFVFSIKLADKINSGESIMSILQSNDCAIHGTKMQKGLKIIRNYPSIWDFTKRD